MCMIDFGMPIDADDSHEFANSLDSSLTLKKPKRETAYIDDSSTLKKPKLETANSDDSSTFKKRKRKLIESKHARRKNFEFCEFREPVLFVGHLSESSLLVIEKPWMQVVKAFDAQPVHRHIYGT